MTYQEIREQVLERDNYICQICLKTLNNLEVHHVIPKRKGGLDILDNLVSFCRKCHCILEPKRGERNLEKDMSIRVSQKLKSRLAKIRARLTLKDGRDRSMEELISMLVDAYESKE